MHANTVWGFLSAAVALSLARLGMVWTVGHEEWGPRLVWGAVICAALAGVVFIWPRIFGNRNRDNQAQAAQPHVAELRRQTEHQRHVADPAIQAFTEQRRRDIESGLGTEEMPLGPATHWIATRSAWARWQAAQAHIEMDHPNLLQFTRGHVLTLLEEGRLPTRGALNGDPHAVEFISPNWWGNFQFELIGDPIQMYRAATTPRHGVDAAAFPTYTAVMCDWRKVMELFPERDESIDATTAAILKGRM